MEVEQTATRGKRFLWIWIGVAIVFVALVVFVTREAPSPYAFLNKYPVAEKRYSDDGKLRILVLKGDVNDIWSDVRREFSGKPVFSSSGILSVNGNSTEYKSLGTDEGLIKVSNDLGFANEGFGTGLHDPEVRPGYCAVAFTRPKTVFDKLLEWMRSLVGGSRTPVQQEQSAPTIHV